MEKIKIRLKKPNETGIFHDTRADVEVLSKTCNILIEKINELVDKINELENK